jgi:L-ascorbate metabolism protein UlaG (beta-lactamase superfamily)
VLRWQLTSRREPSPRFAADVTPSKPPARVEGDELRITLVNHSTVLLQDRAANILTDPVWALRASPLQYIGPRRRRAPGILWGDLPPIHLVLLSHNHYDHLDLAAVRELAREGESQFVAPLGVGRWLRRKGVGPVHELDWGDSVIAAGVTIHCVPAMHFSARGLFDRNKTLWCGYMIQSAGRSIYFAGDTAFGEHFAWIRERFSALRLALLPIGAYEPRWFMSSVHMGPGEALKAHAILGAQTSIAIHHGTFQLADEGIDTPAKLLRASAPPDSFLLLHNGQSVTLR